MISTIAAPKVQIENHEAEADILGIETSKPRLSWFIPSAPPTFEQTNYEIQVDRSGGLKTFRFQGSNQLYVDWPTLPLVSREIVSVKVRVSGGCEWSPWSVPVTLEAGIFEADDWHAQFITAVEPMDSAPNFVKSFSMDDSVLHARLYVTALGIYIPKINGKRVGNQELAPGWTSYRDRITYQIYDVSDLIIEGDNSISIEVGNGWYAGRLGFEGQRQHYGEKVGVFAQLEIETTAGKRNTIFTDASWQVTNTPVIYDDLYDGQTTDFLALEKEPRPVSVINTDVSKLSMSPSPPIRITGELPVKTVTMTDSGSFLVDFGQVLVGWVRIRVKGLARKSVVTVRHAEVLENGELGSGPLRSAKATDRYVIADDTEVLEPSMTFHGFRYVEISGIKNLSDSDVEAIVVGTDLERIGWFESSSELLNRFHENVVWSTRGNFISIPTDCPQRDERLGWTGDIQVFAQTSLFLFKSAGFLSSWLTDLALEQHDDGSVPFTIPDILRTPTASAAAWGDAAVLVPWAIYERTGDIGVLERQFESMRKWVDHVDTLAGPNHLWRGGFQFGDWLDPTAPNANPYEAKTDPDLVATAFFAKSASVVAETSLLLNERQLYEHYRYLADSVRKAFIRTYVTPDGLVHSDSQTAYALAIVWDLLESPRQRHVAGQRLADLVRTNAFRIGTGFVGTPLVPEALVKTGHEDIAYRLLFGTECPSWLYAVTMGATTIWERWDSLLPDGSINGNGMTSFNHYALGAVADWMHRSIAGLSSTAPGFSRILVAPSPPRFLSSASARHMTPYGFASVSWRRENGRFLLAVDIPVGAKADIHLPGKANTLEVSHGHHEWNISDPVGEYPLPTTIRDMLDNDSIWELIVDAAVSAEVAPFGSPQVAQKLAPYLDLPATSIIQALAPREAFAYAGNIEERLTPLLNKIRQGHHND